MTQLASRVLRNSVYNITGVMLANASGILLSILLARMLHPELFGIYQLALSVGFLLITFTDLGINGALIRYMSHAIGIGDESLARGYFRYLLKLKLSLAAIVSVSVLLSADFLALHIFHKPELCLPLKITAALIFFLSLLNFTNGIFSAFQKFEYTTIRAVVYEGLRLVLIPAFIFLGYSVSGALAGFSLAALGAELVLLVFLVSRFPFLLKGRYAQVDTKKLVKFLSFLTVGSISGVIFAYIDSIMLGIMLEAEYVGFYRAAFNIVMAVAGMVSIAGVLFPLFTQLEGEDLEMAFKRVFRYSAIFSFPAAFGLALISAPFVKVVYGAEYLPAVYPLYALSFLMITWTTDFYGTIFNAKEKPEYPAMIIIASMLLNIALNYVLILKFGMIGAAIATVISRYFNFIFLAFFSKRILGISADKSSVYKPLASSIVMAGFLWSIPSPETVLSGVLQIIAAAIIYLSVLILIKGIGMEDVRYIKEAI
jgi:stage V sporulation protein B